jgi:hypothetical protein
LSRWNGLGQCCVYLSLLAWLKCFITPGMESSWFLEIVRIDWNPVRGGKMIEYLLALLIYWSRDSNGSFAYVCSIQTWWLVYFVLADFFNLSIATFSTLTTFSLSLFDWLLLTLGSLQTQPFIPTFPPVFSVYFLLNTLLSSFVF